MISNHSRLASAQSAKRSAESRIRHFQHDGATPRPPVGARVRIGNHVCTGNIGTFTAKAAKSQENQGLLGQRERHALKHRQFIAT